jgi:hypothetical protein
MLLALPIYLKDGSGTEENRLHDVSDQKTERDAWHMFTSIDRGVGS